MELSNTQHEAFAQHVVAGMSLTAAARKAGYKPSAANNMGSRLAKHPTIARRVSELREIHGDRANTAHVAQGVRNPLARVAAIEDRWSRMLRVITERSNDPEMQTVPGGKTGLLCMTFKQLGSGLNATVVREFKVDTALLYELREHEHQAAEELGQWTTRKETFNQTVSFELLKATQAGTLIRSQLRELPAAERKQLEAEAPEIVEILAEAEAAEKESSDA